MASTTANRIAAYDRQRRWIETARTWVAKAASSADTSDELLRRALSWHHERLAEAAIEAADDLARFALDDEMAERLLPDAERLARRLRDRVQAAKMENSAGRTPAEAAAFAEKAAALRERARTWRP